MGTPDFAVNTLEALYKHGHEVLLVVTQPDRGRGRGQKIIFSPVKEAALNLDLKVMQPENVKEQSFVKILQDLNPDVFVVVAFGQLLSKEILDIPKYGCINLHASLLPKYRGAAPIHWAVLNGEKTTGNTTMLMDVGMDTGDMLLTNEVSIADEDNTGVLHDKLSISGAQLMLKTLDALSKDILQPIKQDDSKASYAPKITKDMEVIDWKRTNIEIANQIRGLYPWPVAYTLFKNNRLKIHKANIFSNTYDNTSKPGKIIKITSNSVIVATGKGAIEITEVQPANRKKMSVSEYIKGYDDLAEKELLGE